MSRAITLYIDRVTLSLGALQELEKDAKTVSERRQAKSLNAPPDEGTDHVPSVDLQGLCCNALLLHYLARVVLVSDPTVASLVLRST